MSVTPPFSIPDPSHFVIKMASVHRNLTIDSLPDDLMREILSWLPPENIMSARRVCKPWAFVIADPNFVDRHFSNYVNSVEGGTAARVVILTKTSPDLSWDNLRLRVIPETEPATVPENNSVVQRGKECKIMASCNGLLCYASSWENQEPLQICNPYIKWATELPPFPFGMVYADGDRNTAKIKRIFTGYHYGVGLDVEQGYKVVKLRRADVRTPGKAAVFSFNSNSWKILECSVPERYVYGRSVFVNGVIHWLSSSKGRVKTYSVLLFNVHDEVFGEMELPEALRRRVYTEDTSISVVNGFLCLMTSGGRPRCCRVWRMENYGDAGSWTEVLRDVLKSEITNCVEVTSGGKILCASWRHGRVIYGPLPCKVMLYDPETKKYATLGWAQALEDVCSVKASLELLHYGSTSLG